MKTNKPPVLPVNADDPAESRRFIDMAREVETDETPGATDRAFAKVVKPGPVRRQDSKHPPRR